MNLRLIGSLFLVVLAFSCKKDKDELPATNNYGVYQPYHVVHDGVDDSLRYYYDFKIGSYWVFERESDAQIDCVYVTVHADSLYYVFQNYSTSPGQGSRYYEWKNYTKIQWNAGFEISDMILTGNEVRRLYPGGQASYFLTKYDDSLASGLTGIQLDSLVTPTITYYNVAQTHYYFWLAPPFTLSNNVYYFTKDQGFVRREIESGQGQMENWNLIRYNLVR